MVERLFSKSGKAIFQIRKGYFPNQERLFSECDQAQPKELQKRAKHSELMLLAKFRRDLKETTSGNIKSFSVKVDGVLELKKKEAEDRRVAEAVAKARAENSGGMMGRFLG